MRVSKLNIYTSEDAHGWRHNGMQGEPGQESH